MSNDANPPEVAFCRMWRVGKYGDLWRRHPWAKGREKMLEAMDSDDREAWFQRRDEEDRLFIAWRRGHDPSYEHPIPLVTPELLAAQTS